MRKRGKKLLAIMLAASMAIGQSGTWTPAQENVAEAIEGAAPNAQTDDGLEILTEEEPISDDSESDTDLDTSDSSQDDTEDGSNGDEENGGGDTGDGNVPGDGGSTPGGNNLVGPGSDSGTGQTDTTPIPTEENPLDGSEKFTSGDEIIVPNEMVETDKTSQTANSEEKLNFATLKSKLEAGETVTLNADIEVPVDGQITISEGTAESPVILYLQHHNIRFISGRTTTPIIVSGSFKLVDTKPSESNNSDSTNIQNPDDSESDLNDSVTNPDSGNNTETDKEGQKEGSIDESGEEDNEQESKDEAQEEPEENQGEGLEEPKSGETEDSEGQDESQVNSPEAENPDAASATEGDTSVGMITGSDHGVFLLNNNANLTISGGQISNITGDPVIKVNDSDTTTSLAGGTISNNGSESIDGSVYYTVYTNKLSKLNILGTVITGNTGKSGGAIWAAAAEINISGGTISGNTATQNGGAIYINGGINGNADNGVVMKIKGGTISGNIAKNNGGAICAEENPAITISGGTITSNSAKKGGGIYVDQRDYSTQDGYNDAYVSLNVESNAEINGNYSENNGGGIYTGGNTVLNISGGTITRNEATVNGGGVYTNGNTTLNMTYGTISSNMAESNDTKDGGYWTGGGGICADGNTKFTLSGGTITDNQVTGGGGGAGIRIMGSNPQFSMTGGTVSKNIVAESRGAEGGGISVNAGLAVFSGGSITGNVTNSGHSWGGGGIFCSDKAVIKVDNANVTLNTAGGFGGGIAGCSTGRIFVFSNSNSAFYRNKALGKNLSGKNSAKNADHTYAESNAVFMSNGYADYFCALNSVVEKKMNNIDADWSGSVDGVPTKDIESDSYYVASYMMGLTAANKSYGTENSALQITGNTAHTHGGGILCNGYLVCGTPDDNTIEMGSRLELNLGKVLLNTDGTSASEIMKKLAEKSGEEPAETFRFGVYKVDTETGEEAEEPSFTGTTDENGKIVFDEMLPVKDGQKYIYDIKEISGPKGIDGTAVVYDQRVYRITFTAERTEKNALKVNDTTSLNLYQYVVNTVDVTVSNNGKTGKDAVWEKVIASYEKNDEAHPGILSIAGGTETFVNRLGGNPVSIKVVKNWSDGNEKHSNDFVTVELLANGNKTGKALVLNAENQWSGSWDNLPSKGLDEDNNVIDLNYSVSENSVSGYQASYSQSEETAKWIPAGSEDLQNGQSYLIVTDDGETALAWDEGSGADHRLTDKDQTSIIDAKLITENGYDCSKIPSEAIFKVIKYGNGLKLQSAENNQSCILYQDQEGATQESHLKFADTASGQYASCADNTENGLKLGYEWNESSEKKFLIYKNGKFDVSDSTSEDGICSVKLYKLSVDPDSKNYVITITNSPYTPSTPDTPSTSKPTPTPSPSATPTPSTTPTPSATPTPSTTPAPSETPSVTPPAEETPTPTPVPVNGSVVVTKNLKVNGTAVGADNATFYVALFEDAELTQRASAVKKLKFKNTSASTVTFDNLEPGKTYYVSETDENGEAIAAGLLDDGTIYTPDYTNGNEVTVNGDTAIFFDNEFEDLPDGFYYSGNLKVTKVLLGADGNAKNSSDTFYAGVFADADHKKLSDKVSANIIPLSLNGASSVSGEVEVYMENADEVVKLYVTEVDKNGTPVENTDKFNYDVTVENGKVTISKDAMDARVTITNKEKVSQTPAGGNDTTTGTGGDTPQSYSSGSSSVTPVKTGDSTPIMIMILLLAASALVITTVVVRKRKNK